MLRSGSPNEGSPPSMLPTMMVSAKPMMKPLITGSEMKLARKPSRSRPASNAASPVASASPVVNATNFESPTETSDAIVAADRAAVADIGPAIRWRELPSAAYRISAPGAAYKPTTGETPAIEAYASDSGTSTAQTVRPATRSPLSQALRYPCKDGNSNGTRAVSERHG